MSKEIITSDQVPKTPPALEVVAPRKDVIEEVPGPKPDMGDIQGPKLPPITPEDIPR